MSALARVVHLAVGHDALGALRVHLRQLVLRVAGPPRALAACAHEEFGVEV